MVVPKDKTECGICPCTDCYYNDKGILSCPDWDKSQKPTRKIDGERSDKMVQDEYRKAANEVITLFENKGYDFNQIKFICEGIIECINEIKK